jgi:hypothetical protein
VKTSTQRRKAAKKDENGTTDEHGLKGKGGLELEACGLYLPHG